MIYNLILVLGTSVSTVGTYTDINSCTGAQTQLQKQNVVAACVQQESPEEAMQRVQGMFGIMQQFIQQASKN